MNSAGNNHFGVLFHYSKYRKLAICNCYLHIFQKWTPKFVQWHSFKAPELPSCCLLFELSTLFFVPPEKKGINSDISPKKDLVFFFTVHSRSLSIVPVKVAYYATSGARFFSKSCSQLCSFLKIMLLFLKYAFQQNTKQVQNYISIVNKAWQLLYLELHTCSNKTQLTIALHSRLEAVTFKSH